MFTKQCAKTRKRIQKGPCNRLKKGVTEHFYVKEKTKVSKNVQKEKKRNKTPVSCILKQYPFVDVRRESVWTAWDFLFHFGIEMRWKTLIS